MIDLKVLTEAVGELDEEQVLRLLTDFVASNPSEEEAYAAVNACQKGMEVVGDLFERSEYFVGDLIYAGELVSSAINILKPLLTGENKSNVGSIILGTVHGDLHDIGKNIFKTMVEAAGFVVYDLGIDVPAGAFVEKVREVKPSIVGLSGVLTLALDAMKQTVDLLKEEGVRDSIKIIIGGNPVSAEACKHIGADAYTTNAAEGVKICQGWISNA